MIPQPIFSEDLTTFLRQWLTDHRFPAAGQTHYTFRDGTMTLIGLPNVVDHLIRITEGARGVELRRYLRKQLVDKLGNLMYHLNGRQGLRHRASSPSTGVRDLARRALARRLDKMSLQELQRLAR